MSGHSHAKNIMHQKGASDAKKAKVFNKLAREIMAACRTGTPDPEHNARLRTAILAARAGNMPRERIERAIKAGQPGSAEDKTQYDEVRYEAYGPGGCALIIEALTDNRNRTAAELRAALSKHGGSLGETNSVGFLFRRIGLLVFPTSAGSAEAFFEAALDNGADDVTSSATEHTITTTVEAFGPVRAALESAFGEPQDARLVWEPQTPVTIEGDAADQLTRLLEVLDDNDDVQTVWGTFATPESSEESA